MNSQIDQEDWICKTLLISFKYLELTIFSAVTYMHILCSFHQSLANLLVSIICVRFIALEVIFNPKLFFNRAIQLVCLQANLCQDKYQQWSQEHIRARWLMEYSRRFLSNFAINLLPYPPACKFAQSHLKSRSFQGTHMELGYMGFYKFLRFIFQLVPVKANFMFLVTRKIS